MRCLLCLPLLAMSLPAWVVPAQAQSPRDDERRIEEIVRERYGPTQEEIDALALQGLGPDGQPLIDPNTGLPVVPGPDMVLTPAPKTEVVAAPVTATELPPPDLPPVGPIQFEQLPKLIGHWVKLKTYNGRVWQGQVTAVKGNEVKINVTQRGGAAQMTLKKNAIASMERI